MSVKSREFDKNLLLIAIVFEGSLALVYLLDLIYRGETLFLTFPNNREILFGLLLSQLLFIFNQVLVRVSIKRRWNVFTDFYREMILPIASKLDWFSSLLISIAAGVGEELFFRGFLQPKIGIVFASILFGLVHFLFNLKRFYLIVVIYILIGFLFGIVYELFGGLWAPIIFHCFYDFSALLYFKRQIERGKFNFS